MNKKVLIVIAFITLPFGGVSGYLIYQKKQKENTSPLTKDKENKNNQSPEEKKEPLKDNNHQEVKDTKETEKEEKEWFTTWKWAFILGIIYIPIIIILKNIAHNLLLKLKNNADEKAKTEFHNFNNSSVSEKMTFLISKKANKEKLDYEGLSKDKEFLGIHEKFNSIKKNLESFKETEIYKEILLYFIGFVFLYIVLPFLLTIKKRKNKNYLGKLFSFIIKLLVISCVLSSIVLLIITQIEECSDKPIIVKKDILSIPTYNSYNGFFKEFDKVMKTKKT